MRKAVLILLLLAAPAAAQPDPEMVKQMLTACQSIRETHLKWVDENVAQRILLEGEVTRLRAELAKLKKAPDGK